MQIESVNSGHQTKTLGQLFDFLDEVFGGAKITGSGPTCNINVVCPVCKAKKGSLKNKLAIKVDALLPKCWVCGYKRKTLIHLLKTYHPDYLKVFVDDFYGGIIPDEYEEKETEANVKLELPHGFIMLAEQFDQPKSIMAKEAKQYLVKRGATKRDFWYFKFGITVTDKKFAFRIIVPSFDKEGELNYYTGRTTQFVKNGPKYLDADGHKETAIFNEINIDWAKELTIVEGPFDLLKCNDNATCLLGKTLETNYRLFQEIIRHETPVLLALDNDAQKRQLKIAKMFAEYDIPVRLFEVPKNLKDVGEMTKQQFIAQAKGAKVYELENDHMYHFQLL